jgi:CBS domain-containing protein
VAERDMTLVQAAQLMRDHHVGSLVVVDETGAGRLVVGMLTDRDIITAVIAQEVDPATLVVEDVMTSEVVSALEDDSLMDVLGLMRRKGLRRVPVTSANGVLQGLITLDDLLGILSEQLRAMVLAIEAEQLRERKVRP